MIARPWTKLINGQESRLRVVAAGITLAIVLALAGCGAASDPGGAILTATDGDTLSSPGVGSPGGTPADQANGQPSPADQADDLVALLGDCDGDGLSDLEELIAGLGICDTRPGVDNDGDGILNINDDDIDGDGVLNADDLDVDGDGIPNDQDVDIDDDGVLNFADADADGDFVRDRWDFDDNGNGEVDALELGNNADADAGDDSDNEPPCDENDPEAECNKPEEQPAADDEEGRNLPEDQVDAATDDPIAAEFDAILAELAELMDREQADILDVVDDLEQADPEAELNEVLDALADQMEDLLGKEQPDEFDPRATWEALGERRQSIIRLSAVDRSDDLGDLTASLNRLDNLARDLEAFLADMVDTAVEVGDVEPLADVRDATDITIKLVEQADRVGVPAGQVTAAVEPAINASRDLSVDDPLDETWTIVTNLIEEFENEVGESSANVLSVAKLVEGTADLIDKPTVEVLHDSSSNILMATFDRGLDDPLEVLEAVERSNGNVDDGVDANEADAAADLVDQEHNNANP